MFCAISSVSPTLQPSRGVRDVDSLSPLRRTTRVEQFSFPRPLYGSKPRSRRKAVSHGCSYFKLSSCFLSDVSFKLCFAALPTKTCYC